MLFYVLARITKRSSQTIFKEREQMKTLVYLGTVKKTTHTMVCPILMRVPLRSRNSLTRLDDFVRSYLFSPHIHAHTNSHITDLLYLVNEVVRGIKCFCNRGLGIER